MAIIDASHRGVIGTGKMNPSAFLCILFFTASLHAAERLNVVLVEADDLNPMALGYMGHRVVKTPHLDRLAAQGTVFKNCIVQGTACAPSRNSLISGTYPHNTGIYMNASPAVKPTVKSPWFRKTKTRLSPRSRASRSRSSRSVAIPS